MKLRALCLSACLCAGVVEAQAVPRGAEQDDWEAIFNATPPAETKPAPAEKEPTKPKSSRRESTSKKPEKQRASAVPAGYEALKKSWHDAMPKEGTHLGVPTLTLRPVGRAGQPVVLAPLSIEGGFDAAQRALASEALGSWSTGPTVAERLIDLIYAAARQFDVFQVHVVSGVRRDRSGSRHSHGLAADIVLPGVDDEELAAYFRAQGFVGVGVYTRAGFVHIDVREKSFFWIDRSPPGRRYRIQQVRADEAKAADEAAVARGQTGFVNPTRLQKALNTRAKRRRARADAASAKAPTETRAHRPQ